MSQKINVIVPVAPGEPVEVINNSIRKLTGLQVPEGYSINFYYVCDTEDSESERIRSIDADDPRIQLICREPDDARKAGALNEALERMDGPEYVAIFDVDSRPRPDYLWECLQDLREAEDVFMVSGRREIINSDYNFITKIGQVEFMFFEDMQTIFDYTKAFNHFNGPIAVIDGDFATSEKFNEKVMCEDTEFTERGYIEGRRAVLNRETAVGEQTATSLSGLYSQKVRWMAGAEEGLEHFFMPMMRSENPARVKLSWFLSMFVPFFAFVLSPLAPIYGVRMYAKDRDVSGAVQSSAGAFLYTWFITLCGLTVLKKRLTGEQVEWGETERQKL